MLRKQLEEICLDIETGSMEYNGDFSALYEEIAAADTETLISYILDFVYEIIN